MLWRKEEKQKLYYVYYGAQAYNVGSKGKKLGGNVTSSFSRFGRI